MEKTIHKNLRYTHILINALKNSYPMSRYGEGIDKERQANYGAYMFLNEVKEIEWKKCFNYEWTEKRFNQ